MVVLCYNSPSKLIQSPTMSYRPGYAAVTNEPTQVTGSYSNKSLFLSHTEFLQLFREAVHYAVAHHFRLLPSCGTISQTDYFKMFHNMRESPGGSHTVNYMSLLPLPVPWPFPSERG